VIARAERADAFVAACRAKIVNGGNVACYVISQDLVRMPPFEAFKDTESYYATLTHELTHWTRHESRLNRDFGRKRFGEGYVMEELIAELGSAYLSADLDPEVRPTCRLHR
jgi:antirestriction protein ArdC